MSSPDTVTSSNELKIETYYVDGDTRTITLKNPATSITTSDILKFEELILNAGESSIDPPTLLIGDKTGAAFKRINTVNKVTTQKVQIALD